MCRSLFLLSLLLLTFNFYSQVSSIEHNVYFEKDDYSVSTESEKQIYQFIDSLKIHRIIKVELIGHTDDDASERYNLSLSSDRSKTVRSILLSYGIPDSIIQQESKGEGQPVASNSTNQGQQLNRRVEIKLKYDKPKKIIVDPVIKDTCQQDTMVELRKGTLIELNRCDYLKNKDCISIGEFADAESLANDRVTTRSTDGDILISGGMLKYDICNNVKIKVYVPYRTDCNGDRMSLWNISNNGTWSQLEDEITTTRINGRSYYSITLSGSGFINLDKLPPLSLRIKPPKVKFKAKDGIRLSNVSMYCDCPMYGAAQTNKNRWRKKVVLRVYCCPDPIISVVAEDESGKKIYIKNRKLSEFEGANFLGQCATDLRSSWWFFKIYNKSMYRKYKLYIKDFEKGEDK